MTREKYMPETPHEALDALLDAVVRLLRIRPYEERGDMVQAMLEADLCSGDSEHLLTKALLFTYGDIGPEEESLAEEVPPLPEVNVRPSATRKDLEDAVTEWLRALPDDKVRELVRELVGRQAPGLLTALAALEE